MKNKDKIRRKLVEKWELERIKLNVIRKNSESPKKLRLLAEKRLGSLPRNSSIVRVRNRSLLKTKETGRGIIKSLALDRITLKEEITEGNIPGYSPYSY